MIMWVLLVVNLAGGVVTVPMQTEIACQEAATAAASMRANGLYVNVLAKCVRTQ
jgi:hypothetical protein